MAIVQRTIIYALVLLLVGCTATLAPPYDKSLVDGLEKSSTEVMTFFASVTGGTQPENFSQRKAAYVKLIGHFDALALQSRTRAVPPDNQAIRKTSEYIGISGPQIPEDSEIPSATALTRISEAFTHMRDTDQKQGLTPTEVQRYKDNVSGYLVSALFYERFLKR